jgi:hypothetical protein
VEIAKLVLEYLKSVVSWPLVAVFSLLFFQKEIRALLQQIVELIGSIKKIEISSGKVAIERQISQQVIHELQRRISQSESAVEESKSKAERELEFSAPTGGYSTEYRAIFVVASITNRTNQADQVVAWKLVFPEYDIELEPTPAPLNIVSPVRRWSESTVEIPANRFIQGTLFFRGRDVLQQALQAAPLEPLLARLSATTLHEKKLESKVKVYLLSTLQQNPSLDP